MKLNKYFSILLLFVSAIFYAQNGIAYQAVIFKPGNKSLPGVSASSVPLVNSKICLRFTFLDLRKKEEYKETITVTTDDFGIVNTTIGTGSQVGGYANSFSEVSWRTEDKTLIVELDLTANCSSFEVISSQSFASTPYAFTANNISGVASIANGGTGATSAVAALANLGAQSIANLSTNMTTDATSVTKYPAVKTVKEYVDSLIVPGGIADASATTKGKIKLAGDLSGTADLPIIAKGAITDEKVALGINKSKVGLDLVDNTSDSNKPISTATQAALDLKLDKNLLGSPNGVASLNALGKLSSIQIPSITITSVDVVTSEEAMLGLTNLIEGAVAIRTDVNKNYILLQAPAATLSNWIELAGSTGRIQSVNGQIGNVVITKNDLNLGNVDNTSDISKPVSTATQVQLNLKEELINKVTDIDFYADSDSKYPTVRAIKEYVDGKTTTIEIADATPIATGKIQLAGDLTGTATLPRIANGAITSTHISGAIDLEKGGTGATSAAGALTNLGAQSVTNLSTNMATDAASLTKYPAVKTIKDYVDQSLSNGTISDATTSAKGKIQLAGDLTGLAAAPLIKEDAIISSKILDGTIAENDLGNSAVTSVKILNGTIAAVDLGDNAIETPKIKDLNVTTSKIANASITDIKLASGISKSKVGLSNVDNTSDSNKPISILTQNALDLKLDANKLGVPNGTASLDALGKIPTSQISQIQTSSVDVVASEAAMLSLSNLVRGAVAIRTDTNKNYILSALPASSLSNWKELLTSTGTGVQTVNGKTGIVSLTKSDIVGLSNIDNTSDLNKPVSTATSIQLALKEEITNKVTDVTSDPASDSKYPTVKAVKSYVDGALSTAVINEATTTTTGIIQLAGDLSGTAAVPTVTNTAVIGKILTGFTSGTGTVSATDTVLGAIGKLDGNTALKAPLASPNFTGIPVAPTAIAGTNTTQLATTAFVKTAVTTGTPDASTTATGKIQLAGDLTGTAALPRIADNTITASKIIDGTITGAKLEANILTSLNAAPINSPTFTGTPSLPTGTIGVTQTAGDSSTNLATTAFVTSAITAGAPDATTTATGKIQLAGDLAGTATAPTITNAAVIGKTLTGFTAGAGTITSADSVLGAIQKIDGNTALKAPLSSPIFTGTPTLPTGTIGVTQTTTDNSTKLATTAFVKTAVTAGAPDATTTATGKIQLAGDLTGTAALPRIADNTITASKIVDGTITGAKLEASILTSLNAAPINSPTFTGTPSLPAGTIGVTSTVGDSSTSLATTAFVQEAVTAGIAAGAPDATTTATGKIQLLGDLSGTATAPTITNAAVIGKILTGFNSAASGTVSASDSVLGAIQKINGNVALRSPLASPSFTGIPVAPTALAGTNTTQIATTAFVKTAVTTGTPDASTTATGKIQLAGDLTGTAALPRIADNAITASKIADGAITTSKIVDGTITGVKLEANILTSINAAPINSPTFTGTPSLPAGTIGVTPTVGDNSTNLATTAFVTSAITTAVPNATTTATGKIQLAGDLAGTATAPTITNAAVIGKTLTGFNSAASGTVSASDTVLGAIQKINGNVALRAPLASPIFTGAPNLPTGTIGVTQTATDNSTKLATTAFVKTAVTTGTPDASTTATGKIQLAGDLTGTAALPRIADNTITASKIVDGTITGAKLEVNILTSINAAPINSPTFTGTPSLPAGTLGVTPTVGDNSTNLATTAFVQSAITTAVPDATTTATGKIQLAGDLSGTATAPTITTAAVIGKTLTGFTSGTGTVSVTDTVLGAIGKLDGNTALKAPLVSPNFTGIPVAPTAIVGTNTTQIATTAFVKTAVTTGTPDASTTATGKIQLAGDLTGTAALPRIADNTITATKIADNAITASKIVDGTITGAKLEANILTSINAAPINSPTFTGTPNLPVGTVGVTPTVGDNSTNLATTAFVQSAVAAGVPDATTTATGKIQLTGDLAGTATAPTITNAAVIGKTLTGFTSGIGTVSATDTVLGAIGKLDGNTTLKAPLVSPNFTGIPVAPTAIAGTNTTQIATTAFVKTAVTTGTPDASTTATGKIQLAGDLTGTAALPRIADNAITASKIADNAISTSKIVDGTITGSKLEANILTSINAAPINSPTFTGTPSLPVGTVGVTPTVGDNSTNLATTAFVQSAVAAGVAAGVPDATTTTTGKIQLAGDLAGTATAPTITNAAVIGKTLTGFTSGTGTVSATDTVLGAIGKLDGNTALKAALASPIFTGTPSLPTGTIGVTQTATDNSTKLATTSFVKTAVTAGTPDASITATGKIQLAGDLAGTATAPTVTNAAVIGKVLTGYTAAAGTVSATDTVLGAIGKLDGNTALKAPLASPTFTGIPAAPTATAGTSTTQVATTAFVTNAVSSGVTNISTITADYTVTTTDYTVLCDANSAGLLLTFPQANTVTGKIFVIRKIDDTNNPIIFSPPLFESTTNTISMLNFNKTIRVQSNGTSWYIID